MGAEHDLRVTGITPVNVLEAPEGYGFKRIFWDQNNSPQCSSDAKHWVSLRCQQGTIFDLPSIKGYPRYLRPQSNQATCVVYELGPENPNYYNDIFNLGLRTFNPSAT